MLELSKLCRPLCGLENPFATPYPAINRWAIAVRPLRGLITCSPVQMIISRAVTQHLSKLLSHRPTQLSAIVLLLTMMTIAAGPAPSPPQTNRALLLQPDNPEMNRRAPDVARVRVE